MFRITKKPKGWIVEIEVSKWTLFGIKKVLKPYVKTSGMDCAWHHKTKESAIQNLLTEVKKEVL